MAHRIESLDFSVHVEAAFACPGDWLIRGVVRYTDGLGADSISRVAPEARFELMHGVLQEQRRGRRLGAKRVVVRVEGDEEAARFFEFFNRHVAAEKSLKETGHRAAVTP